MTGALLYRSAGGLCVKFPLIGSLHCCCNFPKSFFVNAKQCQQWALAQVPQGQPEEKSHVRRVSVL